MTRSISKSERFAGTVQLPADKSTAHRAALFASIINGVSTLHPFPFKCCPTKYTILFTPVRSSNWNHFRSNGNHSRIDRHGYTRPHLLLTVEILEPPCVFSRGFVLRGAHWLVKWYVKSNFKDLIILYYPEFPTQISNYIKSPNYPLYWFILFCH